MIALLLVLMLTGPDITGTSGPDTLKGTPDGERFISYAGEDELYGRAGRDAIYAGRGQDIIYPGNGADLVKCGLGEDTVVVLGHYGDDHYIGCEAVIAG